MDNPEKLATLGTQDTGQTVVNKPYRKSKGKSRMDNPEKLTICPVSCVPNVVSFSGLSILDFPFDFL
jgi:hypothetical protein